MLYSSVCYIKLISLRLVCYSLNFVAAFVCCCFQISKLKYKKIQALMKNATDAMKESRAPDILNLVSIL